MATSTCTSPGKAEGETCRTPPSKKKGGRGTRKAHSHETAHPHHKRPPSQTTLTAGPTEGTPEDHPPKTGDTKPRAAADRKKEHPEHADTHHARAETEEKKKQQRHEGAAQTRREGGTETMRPKAGTATDGHHKATTRQTKGGGGGPAHGNTRTSPSPRRPPRR